MEAKISPSHIAPKYRPDIDGLRAIAILSVVAFHAFPSKIRGGFVGVDVFFVISGFIITTTIMNNLEKERFTFGDFYTRRIKRIFPALIVVMTACYVIGSYLMLPIRFTQLGKHIAAGAGFVANFAFWNEASYFDVAGEVKPLLHLWSLGIEEQFYLIWPMLLCFGWRFRRHFSAITVLIIAVSFLYNLYAVKHSIVAAYYSPLSRFWEIMAGSLLAIAAFDGRMPSFLQRFLPLPVEGSTPRRLHDWKAWLGMILLVLAFFLVSKGKAFPGWWALLPTAGTMLILSAGQDAWLNRQVLSNRVMIFFGLISYPLYLWHWMLISFAHIHFFGHTPTSVRVAAVAMSILLSWLTFIWLEKPVRSMSSDRAAVSLLCILMAGIFGAGCYRFTNFPAVDATAEKNNRQLTWGELADDRSLAAIGLGKEKTEGNTVFCLSSGDIEKARVAVVGDCTANDMYYGLGRALGEKGIGVVNAGIGTCAPFRNIHGTFEWNKGCYEANRKIYDFILHRPNLKTVILSFAPWDITNMKVDGLPEKATNDEIFSAISGPVRRDVEELTRAGKTVIVNFDSPLLNRSADEILSQREVDPSRRSVRAEELQRREPFISRWIDLFSGMPNVSVFYRFPEVIESGELNVVDSEGVLLFRTNHNLSYNGSDLVARRFLKTFPGID